MNTRFSGTTARRHRQVLIRVTLIFFVMALFSLFSEREIRAQSGGNWSLSYDASPPVDYIDSLTAYHGKFYAGTCCTNDIYVYDGTSWTFAFNTDRSLADANFVPGHVWSLAVYNDKLYAGTNYYEYGTGNRGRVWVYDGTTWSISLDAFADNTVQHIHTLAVYEGKLYAGTGDEGHIKVFDGVSWSESFSTGQTAVWSLAEYDGKLFAGTYNHQTHQGNIYFFDGTTWQLHYASNEAIVRALAVYDNRLYAATGENGIVYVYDGTSWTINYDTPESQIYSLAVFGNKLFAGGYSQGTIYVYDGNAWAVSYATGELGVLSMASFNNKLYAGTSTNGKLFEFVPPPVDATPPLVNVSFPPPNGQNDWFLTAPVVGSITADDTPTGGSNITAITCTGATMGLITGLGTPSASASLSVSAEDASNITCTATDSAGNSGATPGSSNIATVKIDSQAPSISIASPVAGGTYLLNGVVAASYSCSDGTSGVAACSGPVASGINFTTNPVGAHTFSVTAFDVAGNSTVATNSYNVIYNFSGFFSPVDNWPVLNAVKAGSAVPVKFSLGGNQGMAILTMGFPVSQPINCDTSVPVDEIEQTVTAGGSSLTYDVASSQYVYVWKTDKAWANSCRQLIVRLADGTDHKANFQFK